jgi:hypothetical protein
VLALGSSEIAHVLAALSTTTIKEVVWGRYKSSEEASLDTTTEEVMGRVTVVDLTLAKTLPFPDRCFDLVLDCGATDAAGILALAHSNIAGRGEGERGGMQQLKKRVKGGVVVDAGTGDTERLHRELHRIVVPGGVTLQFSTTEDIVCVLVFRQDLAG